MAVETAFKITMLEGLEVVFIVVAIDAGGTGLLIPASRGVLWPWSQWWPSGCWCTGH